MVGVNNSMKAWEVTFNGYLDNEDDTNGTDYVFANNANEAKQAVVEGRTLLDDYLFDDAKDNGAKYTDIRVKREPELDGYDKATVMKFDERLVEKLNWSFDYILGRDFEFNSDNFDKEKFEKSFIDIYSTSYTVSCATCGKDICAKDKLWAIKRSANYGIYGYFCSFDCLVKGLAKDKYAIKLIQDNNDFTAKKVALHKLLNLY